MESRYQTPEKEESHDNTESVERRSIFIVDDEEFIRKVLKTHLAKEGYDVIESPGGNRVYDDLNVANFDLVISDITMPEIDGYKVLEYVRSNMETVPVIMLTGLTDISIAIDIMKKGAFDYVMKPVKKAELLDTIKRALVYRDLLERNTELERQNKEYQFYLEDKVKARTKELSEKAVELKRANELLKEANMQFVGVMAETIEAKDTYTRGHCDRMKELCLKIGQLLKLSEEEMEVLEYATLLHDLGKVSTKEAILNKEGRLTEEELQHMREHSQVGEKILESITLMGPVARVVGSHHENFDGSGYPRGLKGDDIPLMARIISVADLFDAMHTTRPYRKGLGLDVIIEELKRVSGSQLDPEIVDIFVNEKLYE